MTDSGEILSEIHRYYTELYALRPPSLQAQQQMLSKLRVQIPTTDAAQIDSPIQTTELATTLAQMEHNKTRESTGYLPNSIPHSGRNSSMTSPW